MCPPRTLRLAVLSALAVALAAPAHASSTELGLGADWLLDPQVGAFQLTLAGETPLARHLEVGGRVGLLALTGPGRVGVPIDLRLRARFGRAYLEGLVGPWLVFADSDTLRFHAGLGFGVWTRSFAVGLEVGALQRTGMLGVRIIVPL